MSPPPECHPTPFFYLSDLVSPLFFVNLPTNFFPSGVTPWRVSPGAVRPPPSDATERAYSNTSSIDREVTNTSSVSRRSTRCLCTLIGQKLFVENTSLKSKMIWLLLFISLTLKNLPGICRRILNLDMKYLVTMAGKARKNFPRECCRVCDPSVPAWRY